jgi:hypothetical protein
MLTSLREYRSPNHGEKHRETSTFDIFKFNAMINTVMLDRSTGPLWYLALRRLCISSVVLTNKSMHTRTGLRIAFTQIQLGGGVV